MNDKPSSRFWRWFHRVESIVSLVTTTAVLSGLGTLALAAIGGLASWPWKVLTPLVVGGGILFFAGLAVFILKRHGFHPSPSQRQGRGTQRTNDYFSKLAKDDGEQPHRRIQIKEVGIKFDHLGPKVVDPYIELRMSLWNWSVFNVSDAGVAGHLSHDGQEMSGSVLKQGSTNAHHGHFCMVNVRHWVSQDRATELRNAIDTGRLELDFSRLTITFDAWLADADARFQFQWSHQGTLAFTFTEEAGWRTLPLGH